jgi:hypothetical protein
MLLTACNGSSYPFDAGGDVEFNVVKANVGAEITYKNSSGKHIDVLSYNLYTYAENGIQLDSFSYTDGDMSAGDEKLQPVILSDVVNYVIIEVVSIDAEGEQKILNLQSEEFIMK